MTGIAGLLVVLAVIGLFRVRQNAQEEAAIVPPGEEVEVGDRRGALVDEVVFTQETDLGRIPELLEGGTHQVFAQGITNSAIFRRLRDSERTDHSISYGSSAEITVNPAGPTFNDGRINPFHVREIREALNWLVNRRYIAEELYGGLAVPRYLPLSTAFPDYARLADVARTLELRYHYDPERAKRIIHAEMEELGATLENGRWMHDGAPVVLSIVIRTDDERRRVGDYLANLMEEVGFEVERLYRAAEEASRIWIFGDPNEGEWHLYTGGWGATVVQRDQAEGLSFYYTSRGRPEPLWQAYDPDPEFDELADRLQRRDYTTWEERQEMMARALELAMENSVRVWLIDQISVWPRAHNISLSTDLAAGVSGSALWPYTLRYRDRIGGSVVFGAPSLLTEPWNPVAGSNWTFDMLIQRSLSDAPVLPNPYTGLFLPQRISEAEVTVEEDVPVIKSLDWLTLEDAEEIPVPEDAWIGWDAEEQDFITVGEKHPDGITARARARIRYEDDYLERYWHDGSQISLADVLIGWILEFERADEESRLFDPAHLPAFETFVRHYRGWRIISEDPLEIEVYGDQIYPDAEWIAGARAMSVLPWHTVGLGVRAERNGELSFSSNKADQTKTDWMSFVSGPSLSILERHMHAARENGYVPFENVLRDFMREGEVEERYRTLTEWHREREHFWIGDGLFYLHSVHPVEQTVVVRRFEDFPDRADKWLRFTEPEIPVLDLDGPMVIELGEEAKFDLQVTFEGEPYAADDIEMVRYLLFDSEGELVQEGDVEPAGDGEWTIALSSEDLAKLGTGANSLEVAVSSQKVAMPIFATHAFATVPARQAANE